MMLHLLWLRRRRQDPVLAGLPLAQRQLAHGTAAHVFHVACHCVFVQLPTCTSLEVDCAGHWTVVRLLGIPRSPT